MKNDAPDPTTGVSKRSRITAKQLSFAREWVKLFLEETTENDTEAYRRSDYATDGYESYGALVIEANRIRQHPNVALIIDQMLSDALDTARLDQANVIASYVRQRDAGIVAGKLKESIDANDRLARITGVNIDPAPHVTGAPGDASVNVLTNEAVAAIADALSGASTPQRKVISSKVIDNGGSPTRT